MWAWESWLPAGGNVCARCWLIIMSCLLSHNAHVAVHCRPRRSSPHMRTRCRMAAQRRSRRSRRAPRRRRPPMARRAATARSSRSATASTAAAAAAATASSTAPRRRHTHPAAAAPGTTAGPSSTMRRRRPRQDPCRCSFRTNVIFPSRSKTWLQLSMSFVRSTYILWLVCMKCCG